MKLLMTTDAVGGVWQYSLDMARGLVRNGTEILLATLGPRPSREQRQNAAALPKVELVESDYPLEWMPDSWRDVDASGEWLLSLATQFGAELIHLNGYSHAALAWQKPVLSVAHSCVSSWWRAVHGVAPGPEWNEYNARVSAGLASCSAVVAPSRHMARLLQDEYGVGGHKVRVIHNFSRVQRIEAGVKLPFCLAAGRMWDEAKNLQLLDKIAGQVKWPIRVAGPQGRAQLETAVELLGTIPHEALMKEMHRAAVFVHPAYYEPFGLSVLEAARARCCLVLANIPSLRELWDRAALFVDPRDPEAWVWALNQLSMEAGKREEMAALALERSSSYCAFQSITQYLQLYSELIGGRGCSEGVAA